MVLLWSILKIMASNYKLLIKYDVITMFLLLQITYYVHNSDRHFCYMAMLQFTGPFHMVMLQFTIAMLDVIYGTVSMTISGAVTEHIKITQKRNYIE